MDKEPDPGKVIEKRDYKSLLWTLSIAVSVAMFVYQAMRQNTIEQRLADAERSAVHRTETAFALGISGLKQTAITLENAMIEQRTQNILIIEHCKRNNCQLPVELMQIKEMPKYTPIAETYFGIQQEMLEKSKEN